jgi:hypothetical protein
MGRQEGRPLADADGRLDGQTDKKKAGFTDTDRTSDCYKDY